MAATMERQGTNWWRIGGWSAAAGLLMIPAVAMRFTSEVNWDETDFIVMGALIAIVGGALELLLRRSGSWAWRGGAAVAVLASFMLIWVNLAVGIIGSENHDANLLFAGVIALWIGGGFLVRFEADGMARVMLTTAIAQAAVAGLAVIMGWGAETAIWPRDVIGGCGMFAVLWLLSAGLFWRAAR